MSPQDTHLPRPYVLRDSTRTSTRAAENINDVQCLNVHQDQLTKMNGTRGMSLLQDHQHQQQTSNLLHSNLPSLTDPTNSNSTNRGLKNKLELAKQDRRNRANRLIEDTDMESILEITKDSTSLAVRQRISHQEPLDRAHSDGEDRRHERRQAVAFP